MAATAIKQIRDGHVPVESCDFLTELFGDAKTEIQATTSPIIIYGAGSAGVELLECLHLHEINATAFCDQNPKITGTTVEGLQVLTLDELKTDHINSVIVISSNKFKSEISDTLQTSNFRRVFFIRNNDKQFYYLQIYKWLYDQEILIRDSNRIEEAYGLLQDDLSKDVFIKRLTLLSSFADFELFKTFCLAASHPPNKENNFRQKDFAECFESYMYFNNDLFEIENGEVLVDLGAFDGDSVKDFLKACVKNQTDFEHIFCFEPDRMNFSKLNKNYGKTSKISLHKVGAFDSKGSLNFASSELMHSSEAGVVEISQKGLRIKKRDSDSVISVDTVDNVVGKNACTLIKMDIEGSELKALEGARSTILRTRPKLVISAYHRQSDLYDLILFIKDIVTNYKIYIRHFSFSLSETVIIAIPD